MAISAWMSWEGGVDLAGMSNPGLGGPDIIIHVARMVHTPIGSAASGMILWQPDPAGAPVVAGFVCTDPRIGAYYGPNIFKGTPFEKAPVLAAKIEIKTSLPGSVSSRVEAGGHVFETTLSTLSPVDIINRAPAEMTPFCQQGLEAKAATATLRVDGKAVAVTIPRVGISGGPAAVWSPTGLYAR